jgi:pimeloyl-ACP methyl ester carboxylesterase
MSIDSRFLPTAYGTFHVESAGAGEPVLLIHGGTASAREWRAVLPLLAEHAECAAMDRLGCGESDRSTRGYDRATITDGLFALADALGWEKFAVVGQSFGGFWALSMAFARPERITGLVVVNGAGGPMSEAEHSEWAARMAARRQAAPVDPASPTAINAVVNEIFANPSRVPASFREDLRFQAEHADAGQIAVLGTESRNMAAAPYASLRMPTLVIWGEADTMVPVERGHRLAAAIPGARFVGLPGVGHTCQVEAPAEFAAALSPFLDTLPRQASAAVRE